MQILHYSILRYETGCIYLPLLAAYNTHSLSHRYPCGVWQVCYGAFL
jgi:hypothetical protein